MGSSQITVEFDVPATMRDGTVLRANVYRPAAEGRWPVLLTRLPYGKDFALGSSVLDPAQAARRGYVVIVQDTRGRFASEGEWYPYRLESEDGFDTVAWAAQLPYCDGQVGMYGASYFGLTQWLAAIQQPPALKAMVPFITYCDPRNGVAFRGGALELGLNANWHLGMGFDVYIKRFREDRAALGAGFVGLAGELDGLAAEGFASLPLNEFAPLRRQPVAPAFFDVVAAGGGDGLDDAKHPAILGKHHLVEAPTFNIGGWYDVFLQDTIRNFNTMRELGRPSKLLIGPWTHGARTNPIGELNFGYGSQASLIDLRIDFYSLQLRWFDHWLKGKDTGMLDEPPVKVFVMGLNRWRDEDQWPPARARESAIHLRAGGGLSLQAPGAEEPDQFDYDPADPVPTRGGALLMTPEYPSGPHDQRATEARPDVLTYTTEPLERDVQVAGPVTVRLWAASSAPSTDFVARLCDVHPDGRSINLTDGILRLHSGADQAEERVIDLWSTCNVFRAGHRIRLQVTSSNFPRWDRNPNTGHPLGADTELRVARQTVFHDQNRASRVVLMEVD